MNRRDQRRAKIRKKVRGTEKRPRLVIFRSNRYFYAQLINDEKGTTVAAVDKMTDATEAGKKLVSKAKVREAVFDRAGYKYHGNVKKFVDAVRDGGIKI